MPNIGELSLYDVVGTPGVAADVSHMDTKPKVFVLQALGLYRMLTAYKTYKPVLISVRGWLPQVTSHLGPDQLPNALYNCHLVIIPAGVPRKPGMTRDDLFNINAGKFYQHALPATSDADLQGSYVICLCHLL